jgi:sugar phosphate isomerase/epimerase
MEKKKGLKLGVTLFSFTNEFYGREYTLESLLEKIAELQLGPGIEIVGFAHLRNFPRITAQEADRFRNLISKLNLQQSCLGINADLYIEPKKPMTEADSLAYHEAQIDAAAKMGFPLVRYQFLAGPEVIRRLLPKAERLGVKLGLEIHAPEKVDSPVVMKYREMYERENSPYLGFVPDFGSTAERVSPAFIAYFRSIGIPEPLIALAQEIWNEPDVVGDPDSKIELFRERASVGGFQSTHISECFIIFGLFSRQDPRAWLELMPQIIHIHGKFYHFDESGSESAIPYEKILPVFVEGGYDGYMSSEWEGHFFTDESGFPKVQLHQALARRILARTKQAGATVV